VVNGLGEGREHCKVVFHGKEKWQLRGCGVEIELHRFVGDFERGRWGDVLCGPAAAICGFRFSSPGVVCRCETYLTHDPLGRNS
jgi:hypothetical protein